jgi:hypothetical protein
MIFFIIYPHHIQGVHAEFFLKVPINLIRKWPVDTLWLHSKRNQHWTHRINCKGDHRFLSQFSQNVSTMYLSHSLWFLSKIIHQYDHNVSTGFFENSLRNYGKNELHWEFFVISFKRTQWIHCDHIDGWFLKATTMSGSAT